MSENESKPGRGRPPKNTGKDIKKKLKTSTKKSQPVEKISEVEAGPLNKINLNIQNFENIESDVTLSLEELNDEIALQRKTLKVQEMEHRDLKTVVKTLTKTHGKIKKRLRNNRDLLTKKINKYEKCCQDKSPNSSAFIRWTLKFFFHFDNRIDLKGEIAKIEEQIKISDQNLIETEQKLTEALIQFKLSNLVLDTTEKTFDKLQWHRQEFQKILSRIIDDENNFNTVQKQSKLYKEFLSTKNLLSKQQVEPNENVNLERIKTEIQELLKSEKKINFTEINKLSFPDFSY